ncbi:DUF4625 domain-containing protein [Bacteroides sp. KG68]|uniref:DUF4625 domain-containing protein n=1 Tax=unclassified Bacteroides TaxID=2646097 RepID=UPI003D7F5625
MKTRLFISAICLLTGVSFSACNKDDKGDVTPPVIKLTEPEEGDELLIGDKHGVHLEMDLSDDVELKSYRINIHSNFDHHGHEGKTKAAGETVPFSFNKVYDDAKGLKNHHVHNHDIVIPANATPGDYHLMIYCTDAAKNESRIWRNIKLSTTAKKHKH